MFNMIRFILKKEIRVRKLLSTYLCIKNKKKTKLNRILISLLYDRLYMNNNIAIGKNSIIPSDVSIPHLQNITIGEGVKLGEGCTIFQGVTLGQNKGKYPMVGNNVIIYAGAKVVGGVVVGDNAIIGANAVVVKDVPNNTIVGGVPAKVIGFRKANDEFN